jgi:hypothetical protein
MRICTKCGNEKAEADFFVKDKITGRLHTQCKECYKEHRKTYHTQHYAKYHQEYLIRAKTRRTELREEFRRNMLEYLQDKACVVCNESDIRVLEFDHLDPSQKLFSISQAVRLGYRWNGVLKEIEKCRILCANCHKKHTATQYGWYKAFQE